MNPIIIIPSRLASNRLPNKPLISIGGIPLILRVYQSVKQFSNCKTIVACGDQQIKDLIENNNGTAILTDKNLSSGTDRIWNALQKIDSNAEHDVIINIQGDLPFVKQQDFNIIKQAIANPDTEIATLMNEITPQEATKPNIVKVINSSINNNIARAIYFTRSISPYNAKTFWQHIGLYAYKRHSLEKFCQLPQSYLEQCEKLEQLRAIENGMRIDCAVINDAHHLFGVDTKEDIIIAEKYLNH